MLWYQRIAWSHSGQRERGSTKPSPVPRRSQTTVRKLPMQPPRQANQMTAIHQSTSVSRRSRVGKGTRARMDQTCMKEVYGIWPIVVTATYGGGRGADILVCLEDATEKSGRQECLPHARTIR